MLFERFKRQIKRPQLALESHRSVSGHRRVCSLFMALAFITVAWRRLGNWRYPLQEAHLALRRSYVGQCNTDLARYVRIVGDSS